MDNKDSIERMIVFCTNEQVGRYRVTENIVDYLENTDYESASLPPGARD